MGSTITVVDTTAPDVSVPASGSYEATGPDGAAVSFTTNATDLVDGDLATTCDYDSGETFPLGATTVSCSATDASGNTGHGSFTISVVDTTAPELLLLDVTAEASGAEGAIVTFTAAATDLVDGLLPAVDHDSGDTFPLGDTIVTCMATDAHSNTGTGSFRITVQDTTAPVLVLPLDVLAEATGPDGAVVLYSAGSDDLVDGPMAAAVARFRRDVLDRNHVRGMLRDRGDGRLQGEGRLRLQRASSSPSTTRPAAAITRNKARAGSALPVKFSLGGDRGDQRPGRRRAPRVDVRGPTGGSEPSSPRAEKATCGSAGDRGRDPEHRRRERA